ncbi:MULTISPECIES: DUF2232 domain-containing protein [Alphaproteobacteria]|uniref:Membrane protein n=2 Tax=Alphaproteobacteria TaxID=28211 RepID=A0A512HGH1_9HYPH|nr:MULTISPECIES: DUF2232 domain-containing protein [Alphaproteobacteria]GEO84531.1 membrane protein [Ciceribacter naphthalenivorans]GLR22494.1 membrane protein [Ciceribacter naphthalenivorans]GLT05350.1 membrane protein [Sphingomonas psychrolutea]
MKQVNGQLLLIGAIAGITAALLVLGANAQPSFSSILYAASALPVLIVGLGWGNVAAITAVATAAALGALAISPLFALAMTIFTLLPAGWLSHLANLARPASEIGGPDDLMAWYPLSDILLHLCGLVSLAVIFLGVMIGYGPELTGQMVDVLFASVANRDPTLVADPASVEQIKRTMVLLLPIVQGGMWVLMLFAAYYIAMRIVSASGRALRPREDLPSSLRMNRNAVFVFLAGIVACFIGGTPALIGATVCGTFGAGFLLAGFGSLHLRSRGKDWRLPVLVLAYISAPMILPAFFILVLGLADTRRTVALTPARKAGTDQSNS